MDWNRFTAVGGPRVAQIAASCFAVVLLSSCGGGGGGANPPLPFTAQAQICSPNNQYLADARSATMRGSLGTEKAWVSGYVDAKYLWFGETPSVDAGAPQYSNESNVYVSLDNYFNALLTPAITASGKFRDEFSFIYPTRLWDQLLNSGSSVGFGIEWYFGTLTSSSIGGVRIAYVHIGSPAAVQGLQRGDTLVMVDNVAADSNNQAGRDAVISRLFPANAVSYQFNFTRGGAPVNRTLVATNVTLTSVVPPTVFNVGGQNVGYLIFNDHILTAEQPLVNAFTSLSNASVTDLVLDLRYNSGGYLYLASEVAYMIAGAARTNSKVFERTVFNSKRQLENSDTGFFNTSCIPNASFQCTNVAALPTLNLSRVFILTGGSTCSASESIINGLRGVDVDVRLIGDTTCGKPYGFFGQDNCGISYFPMEFAGVNHKGFGEYADGFIPGGTGALANNVPGCAASDDFDRLLGDPAEAQLATALYLRANGSCPPIAAGRESPLSAALGTRGSVPKLAARSNRYGLVPER